MDYQTHGDSLIVRLDRGEEILEQLRLLAERESIRLAQVSGIGAIGEFAVGLFRTKEKQYVSHCFQGEYEIVSLSGTVDTMDGAFYAHLHLSAADERNQVFGGHLNRAVVSATCEIVLRRLPGQIDRRFCPEIGLNLMSLSQ